MSFGKRLKELRVAAGLTQAQLAEKVGRHRESIAFLEADKNDPGWASVQALAAALGVDCTAFAEPRALKKADAAAPKKHTPKSRSKKDAAR